MTVRFYEAAIRAAMVVIEVGGAAGNGDEGAL
jgi:hypothetical protein